MLTAASTAETFSRTACKAEGFMFTPMDPPTRVGYVNRLGTWNWDKYNGYGVEKKNGTIFKGKFVMGKKEGPGVLTFANGERYEGQFFNDLFDGQGFYVN